MNLSKSMRREIAECPRCQIVFSAGTGIEVDACREHKGQLRRSESFLLENPHRPKLNNPDSRFFRGGAAASLLFWLVLIVIFALCVLNALQGGV